MLKGRTFVLVVDANVGDDLPAIVAAAELRELGYIGVVGIVHDDPELEAKIASAEEIVIVGDGERARDVFSLANRLQRQTFIGLKIKGFAPLTPRWTETYPVTELKLGDRVIGGYGPNGYGLMGQAWTRAHVFNKAGESVGTAADPELAKMRNWIEEHAEI